MSHWNDIGVLSFPFNVHKLKSFKVKVKDSLIMNDLFKKGIDGKVVCEKCNQEFKCNRISNRKRHLERAHPEELMKIKFIKNDLRSSLKDDIIDHILFLRHNL